MPGAPSAELTPAQAAVLQKLLRTGFKLVTLERFARYPAAEKDGFIALLELTEGKVRVFGQVGYRMGEGIGVLVDRPQGKAFVWHAQAETASPDLIESYNRIKAELKDLLEGNNA